MAKLHHLPGAVGATTETAQRAAVAVQGWDCETMNDPGFCAVVVNQAAPDSALADWARAQVEQCTVLARALNFGGPSDARALRDALGALAHLQQQAVAVLGELSSRLQDAEAAKAQEGARHG